MSSHDHGAADSARDDIRIETSEDGAVIRTLSVEIDAKRVRKAFDRTYRALAQTTQIRGFRKGKVPRGVLEKRFGAAAAEEAERVLVGETLADALELAELEPVAEPAIDAQPPVDGEPFRYSARVEIKPVIELPKLEGLPAKKPLVEVSDEDVDQQIEAMRERAAPLVEEPDDVQAAPGHTLNIDFEGRIDGEAFEGGAGKDVELEIGAGRMIPGFEEQLEGALAGEERDLHVTFPEEYGEASLAGKKAVFAAKVLTIRAKKLPELDDEFAKDVGEDSFEALRAKLREQIQSQRDAEARQVLERSLLDALLERCEFEVPAGMVERQLHGQMRSLQRQYEGKVPDEILQGELARMHEAGREPAEQRVREALILEAVAREKQLSAGEDEIDERLAEMAEQQGMDVKTIRAMADQQGWRTAIAGEMTDRKALDFLAAEANVEETTDT